MFIPTPIYNHILSFRPTHPVARVVMDFKTETMSNIVTDINDFEFLTFAEIAFNYDGDFWETLRGTSVFNEFWNGGDEELFNNRVIKDFTKIYKDYGACL
jgi:hypothetical protein